MNRVLFVLGFGEIHVSKEAWTQEELYAIFPARLFTLEGKVHVRHEVEAVALGWRGPIMDRFYVKDFGDGAASIVERWGIDVGEDRVLADFHHWNDEEIAAVAFREAQDVCDLLNQRERARALGGEGGG